MQVIGHAIESPNGRIWGELALPYTAAEKGSAIANAPLPLVIYSHGFNSSGSRGLRFAEAVTQAGFAL